MVSSWLLWVGRIPNDPDGALTQYVVVARDPSALNYLEGEWIRARVGDDLWTDEYSNLLALLR